MSKAAKVALLGTLGALSISRFYGQQSVSIPSSPIKLSAEHETWSKRDMLRMKGKAARKNRGRNRKKYRRLYEQMH